MSFDKRQTNISKGVAVLLLLWHHLFYNSSEKYSLFKSLFIYNSIPIECFISVFARVCVAIFLILSGYGLAKSYSKYCESAKNDGCKKNIVKNDMVYVVNHWLHLMSSYWFVFIVFVPASLFFGRRFYDFYGNNPLNYISDLMGVSYLANGNTMNTTWWYMSVCIVYYLMFPLLYKILKRYPEPFLLVSFLVCFLPFNSQLLTCFFPFILGMYFAKNDLFMKIEQLLKTNTNKFLVCCLGILICAVLRSRVKVDGFFGLAIIMLSYMFLSKIKILNIVLEELGKSSGLIFLFHTFIYSYWFKDFIYGFKYSLLIFIVMVGICYTISLLLKFIMKITKYNDLFKTITLGNKTKAI